MDLKAVREQLLKRRRAVEEVVASSANDRAPVELDQTRVGRLSRMDALQQQAMAQATDNRRTMELARIDAALQRVERGDFGFCVACDEPIEEKRIALDPTLPTCVDCARG